ncbi:MAG: transcription antitermination factor NusB [Synechococcales bacterium]|nr:transcription antitermination factor NusB [Synechococcales bacterium]
MQPRRTARELALLSISQLPATPDRLQEQPLQSLIVAAIRALTLEVRDTLEVAASELERGSDRLLSSETRAADFRTAHTMVGEAIELTQAAINRMGAALELPEFIQLANQQDVRDYALNILLKLREFRPEIDQQINTAMKDWQLSRLARIDQDILRVAVVEMTCLGVPRQVAINEAVELAKRYSGEDGHRFINGVLRRVSDRLPESSPA